MLKRYLAHRTDLTNRPSTIRFVSLFLLTCVKLCISNVRYFERQQRKECVTCTGYMLLLDFSRFFFVVLYKEFLVSVCFTWAFGDFSVSWLPDSLMLLKTRAIEREFFVCLLYDENYM